MWAREASGAGGLSRSRGAGKEGREGGHGGRVVTLGVLWLGGGGDESEQGLRWMVSRERDSIAYILEERKKPPNMCTPPSSPK